MKNSISSNHKYIEIPSTLLFSTNNFSEKFIVFENLNISLSRKICTINRICLEIYNNNISIIKKRNNIAIAIPVTLEINYTDNEGINRTTIKNRNIKRIIKFLFTNTNRKYKLLPNNIYLKIEKGQMKDFFLIDNIKNPVIAVNIHLYLQLIIN